MKKSLTAKPYVAILLTTLIGGLSPFCSCTIIPVIASLLLAGVPLAPVMSLWLASPSMDVEIFFLSVATIGWELAVWRLLSTFLLSLSAGIITHQLYRKNFFGNQVLKTLPGTEISNSTVSLNRLFKNLKNSIFPQKTSNTCCSANEPVQETNSCCGSTGAIPQVLEQNTCRSNADIKQDQTDNSKNMETFPEKSQCCSQETDQPIQNPVKQDTESKCGCSETNQTKSDLFTKIMKETLKSSVFILKFMALAFFLEAIIILYIPKDFISNLLGSTNNFSIIISTFLGIPIYTSNLAALGLVGGLLSKAMNPAAALAFLISGPTTTLPAMAAVYGIAKPRVFIMYLLYTLAGALLFGYIYQIYLIFI